jgi:acyl-CoA thioester hydrolase
MSRIRLTMPAHINFSTELPVRITDINYGGHVGNDSILSIAHELRVQFLKSMGYEELNCEGVGLIMSDAGIEFKSELFYGDIILASIAADNFSKIAFDIYYTLEKRMEEKTVPVAFIKTGMVCYDYSLKKVAAVPEAFKAKLII